MEKKEKNELKIGATYRHFKGQFYKVLALAKDCENHDKKVVVYQALYGDRTIWVRDLDVFMSKTDKTKYPGVLQQYRFQLIE